ncbi:MAG: hypothetical protein CEN89_176 [Candidatus Berkelbacteria bacterium Licking1014_7]|uniref:Uncharacterized protein n=1 Tax=Candidatus Berkelbacteria bacterium Licking1014_7 TaxID=2017147 RepID=A0A554LK86_9BACT|nr:MAG: hypothetical protein CEN89_176 [Candidatus Berkelbacteria bacterium Licking1014_7]
MPGHNHTAIVFLPKRVVIEKEKLAEIGLRPRDIDVKALSHPLFSGNTTFRTVRPWECTDDCASALRKKCQHCV